MNIKFINVDPVPSALIESMRDLGYSMETAIADIIDNSLAALADAIHIRFAWNDGQPWLLVADNGHGMSLDELTNAMRLGSKNPLAFRDGGDLGRFGLGLKTASFSQCRQLTVITRKDEEVSAQVWDLDEIAMHPDSGWRIRVVDLDGVAEHSLEATSLREFLRESDGTVVMWRKMDRFDEMETKLVSHIDLARKHLELTFHRFLSPGPGRKRVVITLNGGELTAFDPFNPNHAATQELPEQTFEYKGATIHVHPYVLPHHSKVSREEYESYAGDGGYLQNQGFYVYRNRRLIIQGTWFRLHKKEELSKLIRVRVDIPNTLDQLWRLNVKKSHAFPPEPIREHLRTIIQTITDRGKKVYKQRGVKIDRIQAPAWSREVSHGKIFYRVNRAHPLLASLYDRLEVPQQELLENVLEILESSFPTDLFYADIANKPEDVEKPAIDLQHLEQLVEHTINIMHETGVPDNNIPDNLLLTEPFASHAEATRGILLKKGYSIEH